MVVFAWQNLATRCYLTLPISSKSINVVIISYNIIFLTRVTKILPYHFGIFQITHHSNWSLGKYQINNWVLRKIEFNNIFNQQLTKDSQILKTRWSDQNISGCKSPFHFASFLLNLQPLSITKGGNNIFPIFYQTDNHHEKSHC